MGCPRCGHEHLWLDCDFCDCTAHDRQGVYTVFVACPDPDCLAPAEVLDRYTAVTTSGPAVFVTTRCVRRHHYTNEET